MKRIVTMLGTSSLAALLGLAVAADVPGARYTPQEIDALPSHEAGAGTSGVAGMRTTLMLGDPAQPGLYTIRITVPAHTKIAAHTHRGTRSATVAAGDWYFGYGRQADASALKHLTAGSYYLEPDGVPHFAETRDSAAVIYITGMGPTDTVYVSAPAATR